VCPSRKIVDFKTSGKTPDPETVSHLNAIQISRYGVLFRDVTGMTVSGLELHHLVKPKNLRWEWRHQDFNRLVPVSGRRRRVVLMNSGQLFDPADCW